jgi:hypothetical protein
LGNGGHCQCCSTFGCCTSHNLSIVPSTAPPHPPRAPPVQELELSPQVAQLDPEGLGIAPGHLQGLVRPGTLLDQVVSMLGSLQKRGVDRASSWMTLLKSTGKVDAYEVADQSAGVSLATMVTSNQCDMTWSKETRSSPGAQASQMCDTHISGQLAVCVHLWPVHIHSLHGGDRDRRSGTNDALGTLPPSHH